MKELPVCGWQVLIIFLPDLEIPSFKYLGWIAAWEYILNGNH
jgi:hypothetical protein